MSFVHLHVHTEYSLLDGFSNINELVKQTKMMDMPAVAITDHGTLFGAIKFYEAAIAEGIKPIIGIEAYMAARTMFDIDSKYDKKSSHLLLLAENEIGYKNLLKIASAAQLEGFYYRPRIDHAFLADHSEGLICSSGCMAAEIPRAITHGNMDAVRQKLDWYYEVFGANNFFLELQQHDIPEIETINRTLLELGLRYKAKFIATNDVHYIKPDDAQLQDILLAIQTASLLSDPKRLRMSDESYYLRSPEEMASIFTEVPEAINNTLLIAERCELDLGFKGYRLPKFPVPEGHSAETYLRSLCIDGMQRKYGDKSDAAELHERLEYELRVINEMGFDAYFLIVWDLCRHAKQLGIWYNARGSAAGSIVAYTLGITIVDPLDHGLIFERFLNPGRISMPDIDLDFPDDRRAEMMEYCATKYGEDKVAQIITFGTMKARASIRDVGRVKDIPIPEVDKVAKLIPNVPGKPVSIAQALETIPELRNLHQTTPYLRDLIDTAMGVEGAIRNAGTHAAGVIVTDKPLIEYVPLHRPTSNSSHLPIKTVTQFEMSVVDDLGLLKVDFLGLATLTIMTRACNLIQKRHGLEFNLHNIPTDDPASYELLGRGETAGVFQVEGSGMRRNLISMKPTRLEHVIAMVALFRPGPMEFIPSYIRRMHGKEEISYRHPLLEPIYAETFGIPVYQEQLIRAAVELAGYTASEADGLRKAVAKKIEGKLEQHREKFIKGAVANDIPEKTAKDIFDDWEKFARYGFNKAHAADYGIIAVQTAHLKVHYPVEYMTALLSVSHNDSDKIALYVADCRRIDLEVLPPDINASSWDFTIEDREDGTHAIRFGLSAVKNVGYKPIELLLLARGNDPFTDLNDLSRRVDFRKVSKRVLECLIKAGALDEFGPRPCLLDIIDRLTAISTSHFKAIESGQMSLFGSQSGIIAEIELPKSPIFVSEQEQLNWEKELIGLYLSDHPLNPVMNIITQYVTHFSAELTEVPPNSKVRVAGLITRVRPYTTKKGDPMGFVTLEDPQGSIDLVVFPKPWNRFSSNLKPDTIVLIEGRVGSSENEPKVLVDNVSINLDETLLEADAPDVVITDFNETPIINGPNSSDSFLKEPKSGEQISEETKSYGIEDTSIPPPDAFPPDWEFGDPGGSGSSSFTSVADTNESQPDPVRQSPPPIDADEKEISDPSKLISEDIKETDPKEPTYQQGEETDKPENQDVKPPDVSSAYILPPIPPDDGESVHMLTVVLQPTGDKVRDSLKIRQIYGQIITYPGNDRFIFHIIEHGQDHFLEFPNFTTNACSELMSSLHSLVGIENVRIEPVTYL